MSVINPYKAHQYFRNNFVLGLPSPKKWYPFDCPFCGKHKKMAVSFIQMRAKCWSCGADGTIIQFVMDVEKVSEYEAKQLLWAIKESSLKLELVEREEEKVKNRSVSSNLPFGFKSILDGTTSLALRARNYLLGRGFDLGELDMEGFGYVNKHNRENEKEDYFGRIIIPYKRNGKLVYYTGRDYIGSSLRYKNPSSDVIGVGKGDIIFNEDALSLYDTVFTLEGALDAKTMGKAATATSGWAFSPYQKSKYFSSKVKKLVFIPDGGADSSGQTYYQKAVKQAAAFIDTHIQPFVVDLNDPDISCLGKDANEIGRKNIIHKYKYDTPPLTWSIAMQILTK